MSTALLTSQNQCFSTGPAHQHEYTA